MQQAGGGICALQPGAVEGLSNSLFSRDWPERTRTWRKDPGTEDAGASWCWMFNVAEGLLCNSHGIEMPDFRVYFKRKRVVEGC